MDYSDPYDIFVGPNGNSGPLSNAIFNTATTAVMSDIPWEQLFSDVVLPAPLGQVPVQFDQFTVADSFEDYQMFKAPGSSKWVPLNYQDWAWDTSVAYNKATLEYDYMSGRTGPSIGDPQPGFPYEPEWKAYYGPGGTSYLMEA